MSAEFWLIPHLLLDHAPVNASCQRRSCMQLYSVHIQTNSNQSYHWYLLATVISHCILPTCMVQIFVSLFSSPVHRHKFCKQSWLTFDTRSRMPNFTCASLEHDECLTLCHSRIVMLGIESVHGLWIKDWAAAPGLLFIASTVFCQFWWGFY